MKKRKTKTTKIKKRQTKKPRPRTSPLIQVIPVPLDTPEQLLAQAIRDRAPPETIGHLTLYADRLRAERKREKFEAALALCKVQFGPIVKNIPVPAEGKRKAYWHEDLAEIGRVVDPVLHEHKLGYRFRTASEGGKSVTVTCIVYGYLHSEENSLSAAPDTTGDKNPVEAVQSTVTRLQRATLKAALGLAAAREDETAAVPEEKIVEAEVDYLEQLIKETDTILTLFCSNFNIQVLTELPKSRYEEAVRLLQSKKARNAAGVPGGPDVGGGQVQS